MPVGYLGSFAYFSKIDMAAFKKRLGSNVSLFADSGAFSAKSVGKVITIEQYAKWLWRYHDTFDVAVNLDVIGDEAGSARNLATLRGYGLDPVPVFHAGAKISSIKAAADEGATYIALGGIAMSKDTPTKVRWIDDVFNAVDPNKVGFHGFGFTRLQYMLRWPWQSCDSSSWLQAARYNSLALFDEKELVRIDLKDASKRREIARLLAAHNGDVDRFLQGKWHYRETFLLGAVAAYRMSEYWAKEARKRSWREPTLYLASSPAPLVAAAKAIRDYRRQYANT